VTDRRSFEPVWKQNPQGEKFRRQSTVRRRAISFILSIDAKELPVETAKDLFSEVTELYDRTTLKAYFGTQAHVNTRKYQRTARYGTGTFSFKTIELSQKVKKTKGYLEKMGLAHFELRGNTWFIVINRSAVLVPQLYERKQLSMQNISLSSNDQNVIFSQGERGRENRFEKSGSVNNTLETNNNLQDEREKLVYKTVCTELTPPELLILRAKPCEETDEARVDWRKQTTIPELRPEETKTEVA